MNNKLETLLEQKKALDEQCHEIYEQQMKLDRELFQEKLKTVFESGALRETKWQVIPDIKVKKSRDFSTFTLFGHHRNFKKLSNLLETDYHCSCKLDENSEIRFDDGDIRLIFKNDKIAFAFVMKHQLPLDLSAIEEQRDEHKKNYEAIDDFLKVFD